MPATRYRSLYPLLLAIGVLLALVLPAASGAAGEELPDPLDRGSYAVDRLDPFKAGLATLQEPSSGGGAPGTGANSSITLQIRGSLYMPHEKAGLSPLLVLVHGNHGSCDSGGGSAPECTIFKRNDEGYAYLGENLASWGYTVVSLDQDQLMSRQDNNMGKGMHARRLLIMALLDALHEANENGLPVDENANIGELLKGKLDFTRIGLMGHSRGGDAVSSFIEYDRMRPSGRRYPLRGVISLAPVDYERHAPYGMPYMTVFGTCDGDVSNLQGARLYERSQYVQDDPYPRIQSAQVGGNHNWYNSVWFADTNLATGNGDDASGTDAACKISEPDSLRLTGQASTAPGQNYVIDNSDKLNPEVNTRISGDPARMGDQEKIGLATMAAFFRRYVGGEGALEPYLTGELAAEGKPQLPASACPTSPTGTKISCLDRVSTSFQAPPGERLDVVRPDTEHPLTMSALGTELSASGFANPYVAGGGVTPLPETTAGGIDWCNPDPLQTEPGQLGVGGNPVATKACPLPAAGAVGGQNGVREKGPVNQSYGRQLAVAWDKPVEATGSPAVLATTIPAADSDVSGYKVLAMAAAVNFFDARNPARSVWDPQVGKQDFTIALTDAEGNEATVAAGDARYGTALQQTHGSTSARVHIILKEIRVPLTDLAEQGLDLGDVRKLELRFGEEGKPLSGSVQLADLRFQEAVGGTDLLLDSTEPDAGPGEGPPSSGPDPAQELEEFERAPASMQLPDVTTTAGSNTWTVDDDKVQCPNAEFTKVQDAIENAAPWETIVICPGLYEESSTPVNSNANPVQSGAKNGLTISKPLKIKGAGADEVTIRPAASLGSSLAGTAPYLRDGGGNVVTISRQSLGSSDYDENFVDISGVTIESPSAYVEAGISFFNTSGRISDSVVGPLKRAASSAELAANPHGWGIVAANSVLGEGAGTINRYLTVDDTLVHGYQSGGILFDDAKGADAAGSVTVPSGIEAEGYVTDSVVAGNGPSSLIPQTGIQYHAGASGFITDSKVGGNVFPTDQRRSVGVLLTGAETNGWYAEGSAISGNGYGVFNADVANSAVREQAPALATGNYWGAAGPPIEGPSLLGSGIEGVSGVDTLADPSVIYEPALGSEPDIAAVPGAVADSGPTGSIVNPGDDEEAAAEESLSVVVAADDDFGVKSVSLTADGEPVEAATESPYVFEWAPSSEDAGETVTLEAMIVDSSGQTTTSSVEVPVEAAAAPPVDPPAGGGNSDPAPKPEPAPMPVTPTSKIEVGKLKRLTGKGTAMLKVSVPGAGKLVAGGAKVKTVVLKPKAAGGSWITVEAKGEALATLLEEGRVTVKVRIVFTPTAGQPFTKTRTVVLTTK